MRRREFITLIGGAAAAWPFTARAQQPTMPLIGFLDSRLPEAVTDRLRAFRQGLKHTDHVEGTNVAIAYRWAENQLGRLPALATELVDRNVAVLVASGGPAVVFAAKAATTSVPVVFLFGEDPVTAGLVASLARPGGNLTGINFINRELVTKQLELLRELVPTATRVAMLVNPANARIESTVKNVGSAAASMRLQVQTARASTIREIEAAFAEFARERPDALLVPEDPFFASRRVQLVLLAGRHGMPTIYSGREYTEAGGLMSYGSNITDAYRQIGNYAGRILKGAKPADLPIVQSSKFELVINTGTARMLGLAVPDKLLATADEVIE
jgi:putative ABC transport system substrate-binding protein